MVPIENHNSPDFDDAKAAREKPCVPKPARQNRQDRRHKNRAAHPSDARPEHVQQSVKRPIRPTNNPLRGGRFSRHRRRFFRRLSNLGQVKLLQQQERGSFSGRPIILQMHIEHRRLLLAERAVEIAEHHCRRVVGTNLFVRVHADRSARSTQCSSAW